jgi:hypothetical protein
VRDLCGKLQKDIEGRPFPSTKVGLLTLIDESVRAFCSSILCHDDSACEVIITSFIEKEPVMVYVRIDPQRQHAVRTYHDCLVIGEGSQAASMLLKYRGYNPLRISVPQASYLIYEAKRFSECIASVGPVTRMRIHQRMRKPQPESHQYERANSASLALCSLPKRFIASE